METRYRFELCVLKLAWTNVKMVTYSDKVSSAPRDIFRKIIGLRAPGESNHTLLYLPCVHVRFTSL